MMWIVELYPQDDGESPEQYGPFADEKAATQYLLASDREGETILVAQPLLVPTSHEQG